MSERPIDDPALKLKEDGKVPIQIEYTALYI